MKLLITGLLSVALILAALQATPEINNSIVRAEAQQVTTEAVEATDPTPSPQPVNIIEPEAPKVGCEKYRHLIEQYDWDTEVFLQIAKAESGCNPLAVGDDYPIRGLHAASCGLFQVRTIAGRPTCEALKDPATNVEWAHKIYKGQGYVAWSVCRSKVECR